MKPPLFITQNLAKFQYNQVIVSTDWFCVIPNSFSTNQESHCFNLNQFFSRYFKVQDGMPSVTVGQTNQPTIDCQQTHMFGPSKIRNSGGICHRKNPRFGFRVWWIRYRSPPGLRVLHIPINNATCFLATPTFPYLARESPCEVIGPRGFPKAC